MDLATAYRLSVEGWVAALPDGAADWSAATPCSEWDVRALVNHVVGEDRWTKPLVDGATIAEVGDAFNGDLLGSDPPDSARAAADEAVAAVAERLPMAGKVHLSYGEEDIAEYVLQLTADHLVHGWDLLAATGQDRQLDPQVVGFVADWFNGREEMYRSVGAVSDRPERAQQDSPQDQLLIAFGRDPAWSA